MGKQKRRGDRAEFQEGAGPRWTTETGTEMYINQMPSPHLLNALKLLEKKSTDLRARVRAECALLAANLINKKNVVEADVLLEAAKEVHEMSNETFLMALPAYRDLYAEARKRELTVLPYGTRSQQGWGAPPLPPDPLAPTLRRKQHRRLSRLRMQVDEFGRKSIWAILYPKSESHQPLALIKPTKEVPDDGKPPWV